MSNDQEVIRITGLIPPLRDKLESQKRKIKTILEKPKSERNRSRLKVLLKEAKKLQKIMKAYNKQGVPVCCPACNHSFTIQNE